MDIKKEQQPKGVFVFTVAEAWDQVIPIRNHIVEELAKETQISGFRKGNAPKELVEKGADPNKIDNEVINHLIPKIMEEIVKSEPKLQIVSQPKIRILKFVPDQAVEVEITLVNKPKVTLGDWKKAASETPEKEDPMEKIIAVSSVEIADVLTEQERDRMLGRLVQQLEQLNLTLEGYLSSQNKKAEDLKTEYIKQAEKSLQTHFLLEEIVASEKIEVTDEEIKAAIEAAPTAEAKKTLENDDQKWYIKSILARNKAINLIYEHSHPHSH